MDKDKSLDKYKVFRTGNLYLLLFVLGMCAAIPGPTLLELEENIHSNTYQTTFIYTARSSGFLCGSILGGYILERFDRQVIFLGCIFVAGFGNILIPLCTEIYTLVLTMACSGIVLGVIDTGANLWILQLWSEKSGPYMQALHFMFGVGAFTAPIIANPFLPTSPTNSAINTTYTTKIINHHEENFVIFEKLHVPKVTGPYAIITAFFVLVGLSFIIQSFKKEVVSKSEAKSSANGLPFYYLLLPMLLLCLYTGTELSFGQLLTTFSAKSALGLSAKYGSLLTSLFWGCFTFFRAFAILIAAKIPASKIILIDLILMNAAALLLVVFAETNLTVLIIGTALLGISLSSVFPSVYSWMEGYTEISSKVVSGFVVSGALGEMAVPLVVGYFVDDQPMFLMYITLFCSAFCLIIFFVIIRCFRPSENEVLDVVLTTWQNSSTEVLKEKL